MIDALSRIFGKNKRNTHIDSKQWSNLYTQVTAVTLSQQAQESKICQCCDSKKIIFGLIFLKKKVQKSCKTKYKISPSSVRSEGGEAAAGYCLNSVSYRVDEAVKYNVLNSD